MIPISVDYHKMWTPLIVKEKEPALLIARGDSLEQQNPGAFEEAVRANEAELFREKHGCGTIPDDLFHRFFEDFERALLFLYIWYYEQKPDCPDPLPSPEKCLKNGRLYKAYLDENGKLHKAIVHEEDLSKDLREKLSLLKMHGGYAAVDQYMRSLPPPCSMKKPRPKKEPIGFLDVLTAVVHSKTYDKPAKKVSDVYKRRLYEAEHALKIEGMRAARFAKKYPGLDYFNRFEYLKKDFDLKYICFDTRTFNALSYVFRVGFPIRNPPCWTFRQPAVTYQMLCDKAYGGNREGHGIRKCVAVGKVTGEVIMTIIDSVERFRKDTYKNYKGENNGSQS